MRQYFTFLSEITSRRITLNVNIFRKIILSIIILSVTCILGSTISITVNAEKGVNGLIKLNNSNDWTDGIFSNIIFDEKHTGLLLQKTEEQYPKEGYYISKALELPPFDRVVPSWNAFTPEGTYIIVKIQFRINDIWSEWLSMGEWGFYHDSRSDSNSVTLGRTNIDTIFVKSPSLANALRIKVEFFSDGRATPILHQITTTAYSNKHELSIPVLQSEGWERELAVPCRSQMVEDESVANRVCSPTSLAMVLEYYGSSYTTKEIYDVVFDHQENIYGNWPFNTAVAGHLGFEAYVDYYFSIDQIKEKIAQGIPIICSIKFRKGELTGAPINSTNGHLLVVRGFSNQNGQEYVIVNDPAAATNEEVRREYRIEEFIRAWKGWVYVIKERN